MHAGQQIGDYILAGFLGKGGMGEVWLAHHRITGHEVAVKGLHSYLINDQPVMDRFHREAETLALLQHPNIAGLVDFVEDRNGLFLIIEYVPGEPLDDVIALRTGPIPEQMAVAMLRQILKGMDYAHQRGIIHRDIKPSNFLITDDGTAKILDFGIAKYLVDEKKLTRAGTRMGTILYMSPEQVEGKPVDHRSDIYSLGVTLFQMLTGQPPYSADSSEFDVLARIVKSPLQRTRELYPGVSDRMQAIVDRATEKNPDRRFQTCAQFLAALTEESPLPPVEQRHDETSGRRTKKFRLPRLLAWMLPVLAVGVLVSVGYVQKWGFRNHETPSQVAGHFFDAVEERDKTEAAKWATEECKTVLEMYFNMNYPKAEYRISSEDVYGEDATVFYSIGNRDSNRQIDLSKEKGEWKVSCKKENLIENP